MASAVGVVASVRPAHDDAMWDRSVQRWLLLVWVLVFAMVLVGGITRLTGSGLSITRWQPISGVLPPLGQAAWIEEFRRYQASPEFREVNAWMQLADFKRIYFWEYVHRLLGRLIGFAVLLPWAYFLARKRLRRDLVWKTLGVFVLGGLQGVLGWYMVQSGLVDEPRVSHLRLAAHLLLAFCVGQLVLWLALEVRTPASDAREPRRDAVVPATWTLIAALALQSLYGAFMAGTRAGYYYATFPDMNGHLSPAPFFRAATLLQNLFHYPPAIHWLHRALGFIVLGGALALWIYVRRVSSSPPLRRAALVLAALVFMQLNLGAVTVLTRVRLPWAVAHQGLAYLVLAAAVVLLHRGLRTR